MARTSKNPLPDHVNVMGIRFQVQLVDKVDDEGSVGETAGALRLIKVDSSQDTRRQWTTLCHEVCHAAMDVVGVASVIPEEVEEIIAQTMEHTIEQLLLQYGEQLVRALEVQK